MPAALVARAVDLGAQEELDPIVLVDAVARLSKLAARLVEPGRMSQVGAGENVYALDLGPAARLSKVSCLLVPRAKGECRCRSAT